MILTVPKDETLYPTLGPQVCDFIEQNLIFGPGDLRGLPARLDDDLALLVYRMYEVFPKGHPRAGRRRFTRVGISLAKGRGKTELAAWVTACELHPDGPIRCTGWTDGGDPIGGPVTDPYIPMVAYNEGQSAELAYGALKFMLEEGPLKDDFVCGEERIERKRGGGKAVSLATSPNARDGARTTFAVMDETHRFELPRLKHGHQTILANLGKRPKADPWMVEITTAGEPGRGSVAEDTMNYAIQVEQGRVRNASFFFFHQQASDHHDISTEDGARAAVVEASGLAAAWRDIDKIMAFWNDPTIDRAYWERVWTNRQVKGSTQAFDVERWKALAKPNPVKPGDLITIGFDGARTNDATGLVATHVVSGFQWVPGLWECPVGKADTWEVPEDEVDAVVRRIFDEFDVWRMYADPWKWKDALARWKRDFNKTADRVHDWHTNRRRQMSFALDSFDTAIKTGAISHSGDKDYQRHLGNSRKKELPGERDEHGRPFWLIQKDRPDSPFKIDLAVAGALSWEARTDAIAAGALKTASVYETRGLLVLK